MSLFNQLGKNSQMPTKNQISQMATQLQQNPMQFLQIMGYNLPQGMDLKNPNTVINYLISTKQINSGLVSIAQQLLTTLK